MRLEEVDVIEYGEVMGSGMLMVVGSLWRRRAVDSNMS